MSSVCCITHIQVGNQLVTKSWQGYLTLWTVEFEQLHYEQLSFGLNEWYLIFNQHKPFSLHNLKDYPRCEYVDSNEIGIFPLYICHKIDW